MTYNLEYIPAEKMIMLSFTEKTSLSELKSIIEAAARCAQETDCHNFLADLRTAQLNASVIEIYYLPQTILELAQLKGFNAHRPKRALLAAKNQQLLKFYETVSRNRGYSLKLFYDMDEAKKWLSGNER